MFSPTRWSQIICHYHSLSDLLDPVLEMLAHLKKYLGRFNKTFHSLDYDSEPKTQMPPSCPLFSIGLWKGQFPEGKTHFKIIDWNWILITYQIVRYHTVPRRSHKGCIKLCHLFCSESTKVSRFTPDFQPLGGREVVQVCRAVTTGAAPKAVNARQEPAPEQNLSGTRTSRWPHRWLELVPKDGRWVWCFPKSDNV